MNELEIFSKLSLQGEEKAKVLQKIHQKVASWSLTLPDVPTDLLHFGYHDFNKIGETEFTIKKYMKSLLLFLFVFLTIQLKSQSTSDFRKVECIDLEWKFFNMDVFNGEKTILMIQNGVY